MGSLNPQVVSMEGQLSKFFTDSLQPVPEGTFHPGMTIASHSVAVDVQLANEFGAFGVAV